MESQAGSLLSSLVISLVAAFAGGLAVRVINLPPMVGYLVAGILIGSVMPEAFIDQAAAAGFAEIGVTLLLFNVGLHFSIKDLVVVRRIVVIGAASQMLVSGVLSYLLARFCFGWSEIASAVAALSFSVSSTAMVSRILNEKRQIATLAGRIAVGWSVAQDIVVILAMVVFTAFIGREGEDLGAIVSTMGKTLLQIAGFMFVMLWGARRYVPRLLEHVARGGSGELFTLAVIVIALGIAYGSSVLFGVSLALGAFFAGVVIGESDLNHHASAEALSIQQIFTILFFTSVGMLFDPVRAFELWWEILAFWSVILLGTGLVSVVVLVGLRVPVQTAALAGGVFTQVGELSFVLSQMGYAWGVISEGNRDLIVAVAFGSIVFGPLTVRLFLWLGRLVEATKVFQKWQRYGEVIIPEIIQTVRDHVILVGRGRVGQRVAEALEKNQIPCVTIEADRRLMEKLSRQGTPVIFGDASRRAVLMAAHPDAARLLIVAAPYSVQTKQIVTFAKQINPELEIVARVHEEAEAKQMARLGVDLAVMGEREIALGLSTHALQSFGVAPNVVLETLKELRQ